MSVFNLPDLGEGLHDVEIVEWHVAPEDRVEAGQTLVSVETDKAVVYIPAPRAGKIVKIYGKAGERLDVGTPLAEFDDGERRDAGALVGSLPEASGRSRPQITGHPAPPPSRFKATPAVRAQARALGIELASVSATGPEGQVTQADLHRTVEQQGLSVQEPLRGPRRAMAINMARAHAEVASATVTDDAVVQHWSSRTDVTVLLVRAIADAAKTVPGLNAWLAGPALSCARHDHVHVGVAVDTSDGLFVPVLRDADTRSAAELRRDLNRFKQEIAARTISPADLRGATFTLSNFGMIAGRYAALALMPPQVGILGAGAIAERVVAIDGEPAVRHTLPLSLTFDHRAVTGGEAARFLAAIIKNLETGR